MQFSIVNHSDVKRLPDFRIDSNYWHPELMRNSELVSSNATISLFVKGRIENIKSSPIGRKFEYLEISNISISCGGDYKTIEIFEGEEPDRAHYILQKDDVVVSTVRPNRNAVALIQESGIIGSSGLCVLRADNINPKYLYIFCKTDYFIKCLIRANKASMYPAVSNSDILRTAISVPSDNLQRVIIERVDEAFQKQEFSKKIYQQAEYLLLEELGLGDWQPKHECIYIRNYSDTVQSGRIDAQYYQPKYEAIINAIKSYSGGSDKLGDLAIVKGHNFSPKNDVEYRYIELSNIFSNGEVAGCTTGAGQDLPTRARRKVKAGDVIVSSIEGSLSSIALIGQKYNDALCSTGFYVIKSDYLNSETLLVFLKSIAGQMQLKKGCSGSILTAINHDKFSEIILPKIAESVQQKIKEKVTESFKLRTDSKTLLENAKLAVEMAIKQDETTAIQFLNSET